MRMRRPFQRYLKAGKGRSLQRSEKKPADVWLERIAQISQPAILALGVFGYFYTVVPVFQNQKLEEETARLGLEKAASENELSSLARKQAVVRAELEAMKTRLAQERARGDQLAAEAERAKRQEVDARKASRDAEQELRAQIRDLDSTRREIAFLQFFWAHFVNSYSAISRRYPDEEGAEPGAFIIELEKVWPRPFEELLDAVGVGEKKRGRETIIPSDYYEALRKEINSRHSSLVCAQPDFQQMHAQFLSEYSRLDNDVEIELTKRITALQSEYEKKGKLVEITGEYRESSRRSIRVGKRFEIEDKYRKKISRLMKECDEKRMNAVSDIRKAMGVEEW